MATEEQRAYQRAWRQSEAGKASIKKSREKHKESERYRETQAEYYETHLANKVDRYRNSPECRRSVKNSSLKKLGWTIERFESFSFAQDGLCAICGKPDPTYPSLSADHNHETGEPRALLCSPCNKAIGFIKEDPDIAIAIAKYLNEWGTNA